VSSDGERSKSRRALDSPVGGALTSVLIGLIGFVVIVNSALADHLWTAWAVLGAVLAAAGILIEIGSRDRSSLFGLGLAAGALITFAGLFVVLSLFEYTPGS
jgi:hypothetical protein